MKKTLTFILALCSGVAMAATTASTTLTGGAVTATAGSTFGALTLMEDMTTGSPTAITDLETALSGVNITGGNFFAGNNTVSLWLTTDELKSDKVLFVYSGSLSSNTVGFNGITWNATDKTITVGRGNYPSANHSFSYKGTDSATSDALTLSATDELINLTFSTVGKTGSQITTVWVNGVEFQTLASYNGNMNGGDGTTQMRYLFDTATTYGRVAITNEALTTAHDIAVLATPEPATATLSLLALAGLAARRRRK